MLVISPFDSTTRRTTAKNAQVRNDLVACLSTAVFIPHASEGGNVSAAAETALRISVPIFTLGGDSAGGLSDRGARRYELADVLRALA